MAKDKRLIYHIFADDGVESEALSAHGRVIRVGLDVRTNGVFSEPINADANNLPLRKNADLVVLHPPCGKWASAPSSYNQKRKDHPNYIPLARQIGKEYGTHYIIENVPQAPLKNPVILNGKMFGLSIPMRRAFECSFPVSSPPKEDTSREMIYWWHEYKRSKSWWKTQKGVMYDYRKDPLVKAGIPRAYMNFLLQHWIEEIEGI